MKMKKQIELTPTVVQRRSLTARIAVASLAFVTATIPVLAGGESGAVTKEDTNAIRPFHINVPEEKLTDLRRRLAATQWPDKETVTDQSQGIQLATMKELARYWGKDYDWRKVEAN